MIKKETNIDSLLQKANLLGQKLNDFNSKTDPTIERLLMPCSIAKGGTEYNCYDSMDRIDLYEYSLDKLQMSQSHKEEPKEEKTEDIKQNSISDSFNYSNASNSPMDITLYQNLILKFNKITFINNKNDALSNVLYFECKIPKFKGANGELYYDAFKVFIDHKSKTEGNVRTVSEVSYHKLNMEKESFDALTTSAILIEVHKINSKNDIDTMIGRGTVDFNHIITSKEFKYSGAIDIIVSKEQPKDSKGQGKKQKDNKINTNKIAVLDLVCLLQKDRKTKDILDSQYDQRHDYNDEEEQMSTQNKNRNPKDLSSLNNNYNSNQVLINSSQEEQNGEIQEIKTDIFDEILVIYLNVSKLNITNNTNSIIAKSKSQSNEFQVGSLKKNYFIMHKIFPDMNLASSDIMWETAKPNFNYSIQMPFTLNQNNAELLDNGIFVVELWNKGNEKDELLGVIKFELRTFLDALKIDDTTISTMQLIKNTFPMVLYDNFYPINAFDTVGEMGSIFLKIVMAIGTPIQINNFTQKIHKEKNSNEWNDNPNYNSQNSNVNANSNSNKNFSTINMNSAGSNTNVQVKNRETNTDNKQSKKKKKSQPVDEEDDDNDDEEEAQVDPFKVPKGNNNISHHKDQNKSNISNMSISKNDQNNSRYEHNQQQHNNSSKAIDVNIEEMFNKNKKEQENLDKNYQLLPNNTFKHSANSTFDLNKKDDINPFIVPKDNVFELPSSKEKDYEATSNFQIAKTQSLEIAEKNPLLSQQISQIKPQGDYTESNYPKKSLTNPSHNYTEPKPHAHISHINKTDNVNNPHINNTEDLKLSVSHNKTDPSPMIINNKDIRLQPSDLIMNPIPSEIITPVLKTVTQESTVSHKKKDQAQIMRHVFDIQIEKLFNLQILSTIKGAYIKYKFFTDTHPLRSETLLFSSYNIDSSTIDVDMKSTHSIILSAQDKLKDFLKDFVIELMYTDSSNQQVVIGKVNIPVEEFYYLITDTPSINRMLFIYGTEHIKRNECIIGKVKLTVKYENEVEDALDNNVFIERQTIYNRKIPKNCNFTFNIQSFKHLTLFEEYYKKDFSYYFIISPFAEETSIEKTLGRRYTHKKHNILSSDINETVLYKLNIDQDLIDYLKSKSCIVYMVYKSYSKASKIQHSDDEDGDLPSADSSEKKIIGKGILQLNDILISTDPIATSILIKQIDNESGYLGELKLQIALENSNAPESNFLIKTDTKVQRNMLTSKGNTDLYLNGKFLFAIRFDKIIHQLPNLYGDFYFMFKVGKSLKKISPKFTSDDPSTDILHLNNNTSIIILNYNELFELDLNFSKKLPEDLYTQFNEGVLDIKMFNGDDTTIGNFYVDLTKLITSDFYSDNIFFSGVNTLRLIDTKSNISKDLKLQIDFTLMKIDDDMNNSDYYQSLLSYDLLKTFISINPRQLDMNTIKDSLQVNSIDFFSFINDNVINLIDIKGNFLIEEYKKLFYFITRLNFDIFSYYQSNQEELSKCDIEYYLEKHFNVSNLDNNDVNILNFFKAQNDTIHISISRSNQMTTYKKKTSFDSFDYCLWITSYQGYFIPHNPDIDLYNNNNNNNNNDLNPQESIKSLFITVFSGMNITKTSSALSDRPNTFFIVNFENQTYKSDTIMRSSHPSWNEELEIKIPSIEYENKINAFPLIISVFSQEDQNEEYIGKTEIDLCKLFPFLSIENECEDFYHIVNNDSNAQGQLNIKIKFDELKNLTQMQLKQQMNQSILSNNTTKSNKIFQGKAKNILNQPNPQSYTYNYAESIVDTDTLRLKLDDALKTVENLNFELNKPAMLNNYNEDANLNNNEEINKNITNKENDDEMLFNHLQNEFNVNKMNQSHFSQDDIHDENDKKLMNMSSYSLINEREKKGISSQRPPLINKIYKNADRHLLTKIEKVIKGNK